MYNLCNGQNKLRVVRPKSQYKNIIHSLKRILKKPAQLSAFILLIASYVLCVQVSTATTLNNAVREQLDFGPLLTSPCNGLLDNGIITPSTVLTGSLLTICQRTAPSSPAGPSASTGGGAATSPSTLPNVIKERLQKGSGENVNVLDTTISTIKIDDKQYDFFLTAESETINRDVTTFEDGYESDIWRITAGIDTQFSNKWLAGFAFDFSRHKGDFVGGGDFKSSSDGIVGYGSYQSSDNTFLQIYAGYNQKSNQRKRFSTFSDISLTTGASKSVDSGSQNADYNSNEYSAGLLFGYDFNIGNFTFGPRLGIDWIHNDYGSYSETGNTGLNLTFHDDKQTSLQSSIGIWSSTAISTSFGVVVLQEGIDWKHEFDKDQRNIEVSFTGDTRSKRFTYQTEVPDRDFFEINFGLSFVLPDDIQAFANARTILGHDYIDNYALSTGLRKQF